MKSGSATRSSVLRIVAPATLFSNTCSWFTSGTPAWFPAAFVTSTVNSATTYSKSFVGSGGFVTVPRSKTARCRPPTSVIVTSPAGMGYSGTSDAPLVWSPVRSRSGGLVGSVSNRVEETSASPASVTNAMSPPPRNTIPAGSVSSNRNAVGEPNSGIATCTR